MPKRTTLTRYTEMRVDMKRSNSYLNQKERSKTKQKNIFTPLKNV